MTFTLVHWLIVLILFVAVPAVLVWAVVRATRGGGGVADSAEARLQELARLHRQGLISDTELQRKREEIVSRI